MWCYYVRWVISVLFFMGKEFGFVLESKGIVKFIFN